MSDSADQNDPPKDVSILITNITKVELWFSLWYLDRMYLYTILFMYVNIIIM